MALLEMSAITDLPSAGMLSDYYQRALNAVPGPRALRAYLQRLIDAHLLYNPEQDYLAWLPFWVCGVCDLDGRRALPATAAWQAVRLAVKLLDDVEDNECAADSGVIINASVALLTLARAILDMPCPSVGKGVMARLGKSLNRALLHAAGGQHLDLTLVQGNSRFNVSPTAWLRVATSKSGALLEWACSAGSISAHAGGETVSATRTFGRCLGVLLQLADDYNDVWGTGPESDIFRARLNLAVCYVSTVGTPKQQSHLRQVLTAAATGSRSHEALAKQILVEMGGQAYFLAVGQLFRQRARAALEQFQTRSSYYQELTLLLEQVFPDPLLRMF